jgi:hypothetical protein
MQRWTCASCGHPLKPGFAWKQGEHFYCGEFCAEAEELEASPLVSQFRAAEANTHESPSP